MKNEGLQISSGSFDTQVKYTRLISAEDIPLNKAAQVAHLDAKYFSTYFRQKTGIRFKDWLAQERVGRAKAMMERRDHSVTEIAFAVGFRDLRTFQRSFKRHTGLTPTAYRSSVRPS